MKLVDLNRDGLPDAVGGDGGNYLNTGNPTRGDNGSVWKRTTLSEDIPTDPTRTADVDGDGLYDRITQAPGDYASVSLSTGLSWTTVWTDILQSNAPQLYCAVTHGVRGAYGEFGSFAPGQFHVVDLNADGLVDIVVNHLGAGRPLINTGLSWFDSSFSSWQDADADYGLGTYAVPIAAFLDTIDAHAMSTGATPGFDDFVDWTATGYQTILPLCLSLTRPYVEEPG